jgi:acid phosphatase type 7
MSQCNFFQILKNVTGASLALSFASCGGSDSPVPEVVQDSPVTVLAAGDIADCTNGVAAPSAIATANLVAQYPGVPILALGDLAYYTGSAQEFNSCYALTWGKFLDRTYPAPGNHEYGTANAAGYFDYFGARSGPDRRGYYSADVGKWRIYSLNSNIAMDAASPQAQWFKSEIASAAAPKCSIAFWHHPPYSSSVRGSNVASRDLWKMVVDAGVDVVLNGHEHLYERFSPMDREGAAAASEALGARLFTIGSGGMSLLYQFATVIPTSEVRYNASHGIMKFTLYANKYEWEFLPTAAGVVGDRGSGVCR